MKKVFPVITVLISLSLLGLIFFQVVWLSGVHKTKEKQLRENIYLAATETVEELMDDKSDELGLKGGANQLDHFDKDLLNPSVFSRYDKSEISAVIQKMLRKHFLEDIHFEFAITDNNPQGNQIESDKFLRYFNDSTKNTRFILPLEAPAGSNFSKPLRDEFLVLIVPNQSELIFKEIVWFFAGGILFTMIIVAAFFITIRALLRQKKLSEIKSDFINNMTHEFKTPLATISLAVDALKNEKVLVDQEKYDYFTAVIKEENKRMNKQVETILQAALLDKNEIKLNLKKLSVHDLIQRVLNNFELLINEKQGKIKLELNASKNVIMADEVHFTNLLNNLVDNALKYSKEDHLQIKISTSNSGDKLKLRIEDDGIGMTKETLSKIFEKFYRAHTGNIHNVKGFGLGLSYVKTIVDAHGGTIKAESSIGKGSAFTITFPLSK
jgi:two-component system phosphate regulon sensor histidine kinase PhoR